VTAVAAPVPNVVSNACGVTGPAPALAPHQVREHVRAHAPRDTYRAWLQRHVPSGSVRWNRLAVYDAFVARWPSLDAWFDAPLTDRLFDRAEVMRGPHPNRGGGSVIMPYLTYLALVRGVGLDYPLLLARTLASPFTTSTYPGGLGVDLARFARHVGRLTQLGYARRGARQQLAWPLGRLLLHRGDPDLAAITLTDLDALRAALDAFARRLPHEGLRDLYARPARRLARADPVKSYGATARTRLHAAHAALFHGGQVDRPPPAARVDAGTWADRLAPRGAPPRIAAVIERYLRLSLDARLGRPASVRHMRDALGRLVRWLGAAHPEVTSLAELTRAHAEGFLAWLGQDVSRRTAVPLVASTRRSIVGLLWRFASETGAWEWPDVPGRTLFVRGDVPKLPRTLPRFIPAPDLAALMAAVDRLPDPHQRAALVVARWSGARRDEIRRLAVDCLDAYPDGHPRLRLPVGKSYAERSIPLHPEAADALRPLIDAARAQGARPHYDASADRPVQHVFARRGRLVCAAFLFDLPLKAACIAAGLVDGRGRPTVSAHRFRHTVGTQLAEGGARLQTIMAVLGHRTAYQSLVYARLSDPVVRRQYEEALARQLGDVALAGPAADALREHRLDPEAVSWLETHFLKTELELGHCLRLPQEGPYECDLVLTCPKFLTTSAYAPRLRARLAVEQQLVDDAAARGWPREVERHAATRRRIEALLAELDPDPARPCAGRLAHRPLDGVST